MNKFYFTFTNIISISLSLDPTNDIFLVQKETGYLNQNVEVNRGKNGRGIFTNGTIKSGEMILKVMSENIITPEYTIRV